MVGGIAALPLGHSHEKFTRAVRMQVEDLNHVSNLFYTEQQVQLAKMLNDLAPVGTKAFFCNSGTEANEAAIKTARKYTGKREIIAMSNSFHGRTMGALAITDKKKYQAPFEPLMPETRIVQFGDIEGLRKSVTGNTAAVFIEFIQGEGGIKMPRADLDGSIEYFKEIREICDSRGVLMVADEVQTGSGRTGTFFAAEQFQVKPDIITTAKGIANGFPMGVALIKEEVGACMVPGDHASTFGGSPLACAAGIATIEAILEEDLMDKARMMGKLLKRKIDFADVRGLGLLRGVDMGSKEKADEVLLKMRERGVLVNVTGNSVIRLVPPLVISEEEIDFAVENLREAVK
jgi:acetylornithine/N-succinyldiaminopimelate aminotransferase